MKQLGPTFGDEVIAAGLGGLPFAWGATDQDIRDEQLTDDQRARLASVISAHDPTRTVTPKVTQVSPRQARLALLQQGLLDKVQAAVTTAGGATEITWDYATVFNRDDPLIIGIGQSLGLTSDQIDQLFALAATF